MDEKNNSVSIIVGIIIVILIALGVWWFLQSNSSATPTSGTQQTAQTSQNASSTDVTGQAGSSSAQATGTSALPTSATVTYTAQGFSPASMTIAKGGTVTFVNQSGSAMWVASGPHPVHTGYDGTNVQQHCASQYAGPAPFDECTAVQNGGSFSFTFDKTGSWVYHNHAQHSDTGVVVVQ